MFCSCFKRATCMHAQVSGISELFWYPTSRISGVSLYIVPWSLRGIEWTAWYFFVNAVLAFLTPCVLSRWQKVRGGEGWKSYWPHRTLHGPSHEVFFWLVLYLPKGLKGKCHEIFDNKKLLYLGPIWTGKKRVCKIFRFLEDICEKRVSV